ncbi:MAG: caspase family protein [Xenococcaceae cyanobacterium]
MSRIKRSLAIIIGIDRYQHIPQLKNAVSDAVELARVLKDIYGYEVWLLLNQRATKTELDRLVANLKNKTIQFDNKKIKVEKSDRVLFYFAGHGFAEEAEDSEASKPAGYFMPQDAEADNKNTWLSMHQLYEAFSALDSHHLLMILDCCFAGRISWVKESRNAARSRKLYRQNYDRFIKHRTEQIITSAAHDEEAQDLSRFGQRGEKNGNSPFAHLLLKVLQGNSDSGRDKLIDAIIEDKIITVQELFTYLQNELGKVAEGQTPGLAQPRKYDPKTGEYVYLKGEYIFPLPKFNPENLKKLKLDKNSNPYKGLASFETEDSHLFYGRKTLSQQLGEIVNKQPLTIVLGASGSGKSSLVKAGLIPTLKLDSERWQILNPMRPGESPLKALDKILSPSESDSSIISRTPQEKIDILSGKISYLITHNSKSKLLLVIDQAEELLTLCKSQQEREDFLNLLAELVTKYSQQIRILFTLRSDFEPQLRDATEEIYWQQAWQEGRFFVTPMDREELQQAIEEPAAQRTLFFESPKLVNQLIDEAIDMPGALPLLSFTLSELYLKYLQAEENRERDDRTITEADYEQLGGVARSLTQTADRTYLGLLEAEIDEATIRNVMLRMVSISSGELARRRVPTSELIYPEPTNQKAQRVIDHFVAARLLTTGLDNEGREYVEPVHDVLVTGWQKILAWKQEKEASLMLQRRLTPAAREWNSFRCQEVRSSFQAKTEPIIDWLDRQLSTVESLFNKINERLLRLLRRSMNPSKERSIEPKQFLWNSDPYLEVLSEEFESNKNWFNQIEGEFVRQSIVQKRRNVSWRWRIAIGVILGLSGLFVTAMIFFGLSRINGAKDLRKSAEINLQENQSLDGMEDILEAGKILEDRGLQLLLLVNQLLTKTDLREQVRGTLLRAVYTVKELDRQQVERGTVRATVSPERGQVISAGENGNVSIWDLQNRTLSKSKLINCDPENCEPVKIARFSPDGGKLATAGANGTIRLWNLLGNELTSLKTRDTEQGEVKSISFHPNGQLLATTGTNGTVILWNLQNDSIEKVKTFCVFGSCDLGIGSARSDRSDYGVVWSVEFSPDGKRLVCSGDNGTIRLWNLEGKEWQEKIKFPQEDNQDVTSVEFSSNGEKLATADRGGNIRVWDLSGRTTLEKPTEILTGQDQIWDVSFSQDEQKLASAGEDGTIRLWDLNDRESKAKELIALAGHQAPARSASFLSNDKQILSAGDDGSIRLWDLQGNELEEVVVPTETITDGGKVEIEQYGQRAFGNKNGIVEWQKSSHPSRVRMKSNHVNAVTSLAFRPDGEQLASGGRDRTIRLWNDNGEQEYLLQTSAPVNSVAYSPDRKLLASAGEDGMIQLWNLQNLQDALPFAAWKAYPGAVVNVKFSQDSQVLITVGEDSNTQVCKLWQINSFNSLLKQAEDRVQGNLEDNVYLSDRTLCDSIPPKAIATSVMAYSKQSRLHLKILLPFGNSNQNF